MFRLKTCEPQSENKVPEDTARTDAYLISERTDRTSSVFPLREPQPPTPAPVTPHHLDSGSPGNTKNKKKKEDHWSKSYSK